jgi:hypothetical protein
LSVEAMREQLDRLEEFEAVGREVRAKFRALLAACGFREPMKRTRRGRRRARGHNLGLVTQKSGRRR